MRKVTSYKCPECGMSYKTLSGWGDHVRRLHPEIVPKGWSDARFFYYTLTGKSEGSCIQCHQPTEWNEATGKYSRYCNNPKCKQEYCKMAKQRMIDKYGKPHLLDDPDKQREMLKAKKNSGEYKFSTGGKVGYVCSYERDFLMTCDIVLGLKATDIISPSPHNYVYMYEGKPHIYIPDFYIPDFNLEIEIKDGGDNPNMHHKIQEVDKVKEKLKDQVMVANPSVNYFKVVNKKYDDFYDFILNCKNAIDDDKLKQVQSKITAIQQPAIEGTSLFEARKDALKQATNFNIAFNIVAGPMLDREIELAFGKYRDYSNLSHSYSYPYYFYMGTPKFIDPAYKNTEDLILEIPLMVVNTHKPFRYRDDREFDSNKIIDVLHTFERNLNNTIKLHNLYKKYPNISAPYVQWEGSDWKLEVTMHYSMDPANESVDYDENDIANESAFINHKDEYFNIDQWKRSTGHNILYIAGLSGSGKSTLGRNISKKYNAMYIELDRIIRNWWYEDEKFNPNGYQGNVTAVFREIFKDEDPNEEIKSSLDQMVMRKRRYSKLYEYCLKHPDQLFVFEGVQVAGYFDNDFLVDKPVVIKNTSRNTAFKRMTLRDRETWDDRKDYLHMKADYKADDHNLDSLRKIMRDKASPSPALESTHMEYHSAIESAGSDSTYYGLPEDKKYPMDDPKHVLLAIKFFNYVDEDKEELLASRINSRIAEFKIHNINVGEKNRFAKYYTPVEEEVVVDWAPNVPYMTVANEGADPSVQLLDDGFAYAPIKLDRDLYEKYKGTDYYPLYIILMKNISPLGSVIRAYTKEEYSHSAISFDASMDDVYTFGNSVIKKPLGRQKSFGAAHESFRKNSFKFSYSGKTEYSLYVMFFKKDEIDRIKKKVDEIFLHHDEYKYNVEGLISYIFNRPKTDPKKLFCSQFVALVINSGRNGILNKDPSLYSPVGLTTIRGICHVETGHIEDYDQYRVEKKTHAVFDSLIENRAYEALEHANIMYNA